MVWLPSSVVRGKPCDLRLYHVCQGPGAAAPVIEPCALRPNMKPAALGDPGCLAPCAPIPTGCSRGPGPGESVLGSRFISVLDRKRF